MRDERAHHADPFPPHRPPCQNLTKAATARGRNSPYRTLLILLPQQAARKNNEQEPPMRKVLLASVAVAALLAGPMAVAQNSPSQQSPAATSDQPASKAQQREPKAKSRDDMGAPKAGQSTQQERRDKGNMSGEGRQTTGQGAAGSEDRSKSGQKSGAQDMKKSGAKDMEKGTTGSSQNLPDDKSKAGQKAGTSGKKETTGQSSGTPGAPQGKDRSTTGQSQSEQPARGERGKRGNEPAAQQGQTAPSGTTQGNQPGSNRGSGTSQSSTTTQGSNAAGKPEVQSKFNQVIEKQKFSNTNVNVDVSVGSSLPRSVRVVDVPPDIVRINPEFRGKKFTVVRDEIVIIEPSTHKVISVIPRSGRATTGTSTSVRQNTSSKLQLAPEKRRFPRAPAITEEAAPRCSDVQLSVGTEVSRSIRLNPFPEEVVREVPQIRAYQFCIQDNDVVLVDPGEHRIVEIID